MAFMVHSTEDGRVPTIEYLPVSAITPKVGMALVQSSGNLAIASGTTKPTYISMCERDSVCTAGEEIPVIRVLPDMKFGTTFSVAATALKLGNKVTVSSDGLQVTATTTDGIAEVVGMSGTASGSECIVRFA